MSKFNSYKLRKWATACRIRDNFVCRLCGRAPLEEAYGILHCHHLYAKSQHPDLVYKPSNGITVCLSCHMSVIHGSNPWDLSICIKWIEPLRHFFTDWDHEFNKRFECLVDGKGEPISNVKDFIGKNKVGGSISALLLQPAFDLMLDESWYPSFVGAP